MNRSDITEEMLLEIRKSLKGVRKELKKMSPFKLQSIIIQLTEENIILQYNQNMMLKELEGSKENNNETK